MFRPVLARLASRRRGATSIEAELSRRWTRLASAMNRNDGSGVGWPMPIFPKNEDDPQANGDCYHCNPTLYSDGPKNAVQARNVSKTNDGGAFSFRRNMGGRVLGTRHQNPWRASH